MKEKSTISWILKVLIGWRLVLLVVAMYAIAAIPFKESFPYWETLLAPNGHPLFWSWGNFDGVHYITIAKQGYSAQFTQAFFPLYPLLMRFVARLTGEYISAGLLISHISAVVAFILFYKLVRLDKGEGTAKKTLIHLLLFPTAFYFGALYSESLFLAFVLGSFYAARKKHWWIAGLLGAAASATRIFGIFLLPSLLLEWYYGRGKKTAFSRRELFQAVLPILLSATGLLLYMYYLNRAFSDPILFLNSQPAFGAQRSSDKLILLYQVFWRYTKMLATVDINSLLYFTVSQEMLSGFLFLGLTVLAFKYTRLSYAIFGLFSYLAPTLTGTFSSMPRYVLILFPSFMILGMVKNPRFHKLWWFVSVILLGINTALFVRGYWVA